MDFGFYYVPDENRVLFHFRPDDPAASPCCYDTVVSESRIVDYIGIGRGQLPAEDVLRALAHVPGHLRVLLPGDEAGRRVAALPRRRRLRGRLPLPRHPARAVVGRVDVRGADARAVRARGALGAAQLGREPPAHRQGADLPRDGGGRLRLLGLLAGEQARGRLRRLGRGRRRHGSERHAVERGRARSSTTASPAAPAARRSPTRRRRPTRTASSRRTPPSSGCATPPRRPRRTCAGWPATSPGCTASGASATA